MLSMEELKQRGIETRAYFYPPVHEQAYFHSVRNQAPAEDGVSFRAG